MGACPRCDGLGTISFFDPKRVVAFPQLSLASGAIKGWDRRNQFYFQMLSNLAAFYEFDIDQPFEQLPEAARKAVLHGSGKTSIPFTYVNDCSFKARKAPDAQSDSIHGMEGSNEAPHSVLPSLADLACYLGRWPRLFVVQLKPPSMNHYDGPAPSLDIGSLIRKDAPP